MDISSVYINLKPWKSVSKNNSNDYAIVTNNVILTDWAMLYWQIRVYCTDGNIYQLRCIILTDWTIATEFIVDKNQGVYWQIDRQYRCIATLPILMEIYVVGKTHFSISIDPKALYWQIFGTFTDKNWPSVNGNFFVVMIDTRWFVVTLFSNLDGIDVTFIQRCMCCNV